jgi:hypothetical protein
VSKEEIAAHERASQIAKKMEMRLRQRVVKGRLKFDDLRPVCQCVWGCPVRLQSIQTTQTHPMIEETGIAQASDRKQFVVALQKYGFTMLAMFD